MSAKNQESYEVHTSADAVPIKSWTRGVPLDERALEQLQNAARLPFIHGHIAVMPDVHVGIGAVGSVIPTIGAVIPAAVGVDIGCGMMAVRTTLTASDLPETLAPCARPCPTDARATPSTRAPGATHRNRSRGRGRLCLRASTRSWPSPPA